MKTGHGNGKFQDLRGKGMIEPAMAKVPKGVRDFLRGQQVDKIIIIDNKWNARDGSIELLFSLGVGIFRIRRKGSGDNRAHLFLRSVGHAGHVRVACSRFPKQDRIRVDKILIFNEVGIKIPFLIKVIFYDLVETALFLPKFHSVPFF